MGSAVRSSSVQAQRDKRVVPAVPMSFETGSAAELQLLPRTVPAAENGDGDGDGNGDGNADADAAKRRRVGAGDDDGDGTADVPAVAAVQLMAVGFCGLDESASVDDVLALSREAPFAEWGVLFRPEKAGAARFPGEAYVAELSRKAKLEAVLPRLAAHLCSTRCEEVLRGDPAFVQSLWALGFRRVQVNATKANGVDTASLAAQVDNVVKCIKAVPGVEWILQRNEETRPLWEPILSMEDLRACASVLFDDSVGTGVHRTCFPDPHVAGGFPCGYAGGIGPSNVLATLDGMQAQVGEFFAEGSGRRPPWIDMESSLRVVDEDGTDSFSLDKVRATIALVKDRVQAAKEQ